MGLGDKLGVFNIVNINTGNRGMNRIVHEKTNSSTVVPIHVITLDSYMLENKLDKIDLIKIDVEGFEYNVLKGSQAIINAFHPRFFIELDDDNLIEQGSSAKELIKFLTDNGYEIIHAENNQHINQENNFTHCHYDIIAKYVG